MMAAINPFPGKSQAWLEAELSKVLDEQAAGKTILSAQDGDVQGVHQIQTSVAQRKYQLLVALTLVAPSTYPPATTLPKRVTVARFMDYAR